MITEKSIILIQGLIESNRIQVLKGKYYFAGLDGFSERCAIYRSTGVSFAKWHCIFKIRKYTPSSLAINENCNILARYVSVCQQNGVLPIIMIEVASDGDHDLMTAQKVLEMILASLYKIFHEHRIFLEGTILSTNMVIAGESCNKKFTYEDIAMATVTALLRRVPPAVAGVAFLSGSMNDADAIFTLNNISRSFEKKPWFITFCFGYVIQKYFLVAWKGQPENLKIASKLLAEKIKDIGRAVKGEYTFEDIE